MSKIQAASDECDRLNQRLQAIPDLRGGSCVLRQSEIDGTAEALKNEYMKIAEELKEVRKTLTNAEATDIQDKFQIVARSGSEKIEKAERWYEQQTERTQRRDKETAAERTYDQLAELLKHITHEANRLPDLLDELRSNARMRDLQRRHSQRMAKLDEWIRQVYNAENWILRSAWSEGRLAFFMHHVRLAKISVNNQEHSAWVFQDQHLRRADSEQQQRQQNPARGSPPKRTQERQHRQRNDRSAGNDMEARSRGREERSSPKRSTSPKRRGRVVSIRRIRIVT